MFSHMNCKNEWIPSVNCVRISQSLCSWKGQFCEVYKAKRKDYLTGVRIKVRYLKVRSVSHVVKSKGKAK